MAFKTWKIGKANAEIARLETVVSDLTKERDELKAALEDNNAEVAKDVQEQLSQANTQITDLNGQLSAKDGQIAKLQTDLSAASTELEKLKADAANGAVKINQLASQKAAEITSAQGQPPIATAPATSPAADSTDRKATVKKLNAQDRLKAEMQSRTRFGN